MIVIHFTSLIPKMSMFTLAICLTTSNLPWFIHLISQVPMQCCSLQHRTLLPSPVTSTTGCCFCFGSILSFFLELFLHWSPVACWVPTDLRCSSFSVLCFCLFIWFMGFSREEYWSSLPFPSPVDHVLSELSAMIRPSWVALHDMAHSFIELHKPLHYNKAMMQAGRVTSWNQDRQEKHQQPQICGWYHSNGRVKRN